MPKYSQGEEYEEEDYGFESEETEYDEEDAELEIDTFYGVPKKYVYLGGAIILVIIIGAFIFSSIGKQSDASSDEDVVLDDNDFLDTSDYDIIIDTEPAAATSDLLVVEPVAVEISDITDADKEMLRGLGYTGDEIEIALSNGFDVQAMVDHAIALRDAEAASAMERMSDRASDEFKDMLYYTYLGQPEVWNPQGSREEITEQRASVKINADYVKCPTRGNQLFLKCKIATDAYVWYQCPPVRWLSLPDEGNIVLNVDFWLMNDVAYVTGIVEADSTLNSIDSGHSYQDISDGVVEYTEEAEESESEVFSEEASESITSEE